MSVVGEPGGRRDRQRPVTTKVQRFEEDWCKISEMDLSCSIHLEPVTRVPAMFCVVCERFAKDLFQHSAGTGENKRDGHQKRYEQYEYSAAMVELRTNKLEQVG